MKNIVGVKISGQKGRSSMSYGGDSAVAEQSVIPKIKSGWVRTKIKNWLNKGEVTFPSSRVPNLQTDNRINFRIYKATGGLVVELDQYNNRVGGSSCDLHIIKDEENLGESLEKIITLHLMKN